MTEFNPLHAAHEVLLSTSIVDPDALRIASKTILRDLWRASRDLTRRSKQMTDQPIKFIDGPPPASVSSGSGGAESGRVGEIRANLRANPGVWAEVSREPKDNARAAYMVTRSLKVGRVGAGIESVTRSDGSDVVVYARFVA